MGVGTGVSREVIGGFSLTLDQWERMATRMDQILEAIIDG